MTSEALGEKKFKTSHQLLRATQEPGVGQRYRAAPEESLTSGPRSGSRRGGTDAASDARLWAGRLLRALPRLVRKRGAPTSHWSPTTHAQTSVSHGLPAAPRFCGLSWKRLVGRDARTVPCLTVPGAQALISAGIWRPVPARAPQPNSMAIVRRPLCSGGGHFLQDREGGGRQETEMRRPALPGVLSWGLGSVRSLLGGWESRNFSSWRSGSGGWVFEIRAYRAGGGAEEGP